jgi:hypothetical protein
LNQIYGLTVVVDGTDDIILIIRWGRWCISPAVRNWTE